MARIAQFLVAGLLACLISGIVTSKVSSDIALKYKFNALKEFQLGTKGKKITLKFDVEGYSRPVNEKGSVISITMNDMKIIVDRDNDEQIDLTKCKSNEDFQKDIKRPFLVVFNDNGALKHIKASRKESELSSNLKLYAASLFQLDLPQLQNKSSSQGRNQLTYAGLCPMHSEVTKTANGTILNRFTSNLVKCSAVKNDYRRDGLTCLSNTCRSHDQRNLKWLGVLNAEVVNVNNQPVIQDVELDMPVSYNPFVNSDVKLVGHINLKNRLVSIGEAKNVPSLNPNDADIVNVARYLKINRNTCESSAGSDDGKDDLREMYSALACQESMAIIYEDVLNRAIECN